MLFSLFPPCPPFCLREVTGFLRSSERLKMVQNVLQESDRSK